MTREPTIQDVLANVQDVLDTLNTFATHVDGEFHAIRNELGEVRNELDGVSGKIVSVKRTLTTLVTKDYLDEKIADLRGDLVILARKGNTKLSTLVEELVAQRILDPAVARRILALEPFAQP